MLTSSQATLTFAADMNEPVMANTPVAPRTDTMIKAIVNGVTTPPDKIQLATWDNTLPESNAREIENDMARRTELEEASSANGGVEATNGQEGTYVRGASKPPMAYGVPLEIGPNGVGSKDNGTHYQVFDGAHIRKMMIDAPQTTSLTIHFACFISHTIMMIRHDDPARCTFLAAADADGTTTITVVVIGGGGRSGIDTGGGGGGGKKLGLDRLIMDREVMEKNKATLGFGQDPRRWILAKSAYLERPARTAVNAEGAAGAGGGWRNIDVQVFSRALHFHSA
ncbi:hypothetical protein RI054_02g08280 [Pseudoscourfieldia marina]